MDSASDRPGCTVWGCELNGQQKSFTLEIKDDSQDHELVIGTVCLGAESKDEVNVVTVQAKNSMVEQPIPIATLRRTILPMVSIAGIDCTPPVTFQLQAGSGPVYISGQHLYLEEHTNVGSGSEDS